MRTRISTVLIALLAMAAMVPPSWASPADEPGALQVAQAALVRAVRVGSDEVVPKRALLGARVGEVFMVHHPQTLEPAYSLVPVQSADGETVGMLGLSAAADRVLWYKFGGMRGNFPRVSTREAEARARRSIEALQGDSRLGEALLIEGCDRHLYWRFVDPTGGVWFVDVEQPDRPPLGTVLGTARPALVPDDAVPQIERAPRPRPRRIGPAPGCMLGAGARPAAYNMPGIPYHYQITSWYCGPASLQMIFDYYGEEIGQHNIADVANDVVDVGCYCSDMARAANFSGMSVAIQDSSLVGYTQRQLGYGCVEYWWGADPGVYDDVKDILCAHYPLMACTWYSGTHTSGHYRVLKGYDDSLGVFVIHDPWYYGSISGPNVLIDQAFFVENLWLDWTGCWAISPAPWLVRPDFPSSVSQGDTFTVDLTVVYRSPLPSYPVTAHDCSATISLSPGLTLAGGSDSVALPDITDGDSTTVSWDVIATGPPGEEGMAFQAQGIIDYNAASYGSYSDSIGGHACETVEITADLAAGWGTEERLTDDDAAQATCFPGARAMVVDGDGTAHLVWEDTRDGRSSIYYRKRLGGAWQAEEKISVDSAFCFSPCIDVGPDGRLHVAYVGTMTPQGNHEIYYKSFTPGVGWSAEEQVTHYYETDLNPSVTAGDSLVYMAWESRQGGYFRAHAVFSSVRSDTGWSLPVDVDASPARDSFRPSLAYGADGLLHIVYERHTSNTPNEKEKVVHKSWDGVAWSPRTGLSSGGSYGRTPVIAAGDDSTLHVVWQDGENGGGDIFYARYDGSAWQPVEQIVTGATEASTPSVAVDALGHVHVVWVDHRHAETEIYYMANDGSGWSAEQRLSRAPGASMLPVVRADPAGGALVAWTDLRHGNADLYFRGPEAGSGVAPRGPAATAGGMLRLAPPYPMPFASETTVSFWLARPSEVSLEIFDIRGRLVRTLASGHHVAGAHEVRWDGRGDSGRRAESGVYFLRCASPLGRESRRVVLVR